MATKKRFVPVPAFDGGDTEGWRASRGRKATLSITSVAEQFNGSLVVFVYNRLIMATNHVCVVCDNLLSKSENRDIIRA